MSQPEQMELPKGVREQNNSDSFLWSSTGSLFHSLPQGSSYKGLIPARRVLQLQKNPEMASQSSRKDDRTSDVETILVIFSSTRPADRWVNGNAESVWEMPQIQLVDSRVGQAPSPTQELSSEVCFF